MKVLFVNQVPEVNNKYAFSFAKCLLDEQIDITTCGIESDDVSAYSLPYTNLFLPYSKKKGLIKKTLSYFESWRRIETYCIDKHVDILHVQWYILSPIDYYFHKKLKNKGINIVVTIHDLLPFNRKFYDFYFHKKIYQFADAVISQAQSNKEKLINDFNVSSDKISFVPHGHYMDYAELEDQKLCREKLGLPKDKKMILFFGQIKKVKGVDILLEAFHMTLKNHDDVICVIAGKVWKDDFNFYQEIIDRLNIKNQVKLYIRFIEDDEIKYFFNATDIVALPYKQVYQSGVVLLSYAYEKPVIATKEGEFVNVISDKYTGILVDSDNAYQFSEAMDWFFDNPESMKEFGKRGKHELMEQLSWRKIAKTVSAIYNDIYNKNTH